MSYMRLQDFPEPVRLLLLKLSDPERNKLLYPHENVTRARQIQETIIQAIDQSIGEGESEAPLLDRLREYSATHWP